VSQPTLSPERQETPATRGRRQDLDGVRGLALALVVLFHVFGNGRISGGIDVFLALTGYLATQSLLRRSLLGGGRLDLHEHFVRIGRRLIPPVIVVLLGVTAATVIFMPPSRWLQVARETIASALYYENWELINSQLTYEAAGPSTSPLQHFWSLSIQGQFHLVWPAVVLLSVWLSVRLRSKTEAVMLGLVASIFAASFGYSVYRTAIDQPVAYFHTATRFWELALGGLAALLIPRLRLPVAMRFTLAWVGIAMIVSSGFLIDGGAVFPGYAALWPVMGLLFVLAGGQTGMRLSTDRWLSSRPLKFIADISYSLYLWHWPLLVFFLFILDREKVGLRGAVIIVGASTILAWLTTKLVEQPVQRWKPRITNRRIAAIALSSALVLAMIGVGTVREVEASEARAIAQLDAEIEALRALAEANFALLDDVPRFPVDPSQLLPPLEIAAKDRPGLYDLGCRQSSRDAEEYDEVLICPPLEVDDPVARVVMTGGSHVQQWWGAVIDIAERNRWELIVVEKSGCQLKIINGPPQNSCDRWNAKAFDVIKDLQPDLVITLGSTTRGLREAIPASFIAGWRDLDTSGIPVLALRDTIRTADFVPECLERTGYDALECGGRRDEIYSPTFPFGDVPIPTNVSMVDMTPFFCGQIHCPAIIGNMIVYRDTSHITNTYAKVLIPQLERKMRLAAPWIFDRAS
jgi:peptidoglycan/LPS O-acetylase OafA/YrhL